MNIHWRFGTFGAILVSASSAGAQAVTTAGTRVEASGQVRIVGDGPNRLLISTGGLTFSLSVIGDGQLALASAGTSGAVRREGGARGPGREAGLTGSADNREIVSLSVAGGNLREDGKSESGEGHLGVVIASFN